jgi:arginine-tRNA-protein transferase
MQELLRVVEEPRQCPYLPLRKASLEYRLVLDLDAKTYADLLARGYRRFGHQLFRPACSACDECVSLRVLAPLFQPSRSQRRVWRQNRHIRVERRRPFVSDQHVRLLNRYHEFMARHRGWPYEAATKESYADSFVLGGGNFSWQWLYYDHGHLVGVALMDEVENAISLVYHFHDPRWRPLSPGTFSVLTQLAYATQQGLNYAYPGYWVAGNSSMGYKTKFQPHERLVRYPADGEQPVWTTGRHEPPATNVWPHQQQAEPKATRPQETRA